MEQGKTVFVNYVGHPVWHERLLLERVGASGAKWVIATPDNDVYLEDFGHGNPDIEGFRLTGSGGQLPGNIMEEDAYRFRQIPTGGELSRLKAEASLVAKSEIARLGDEGGAAGVWRSIEAAGGLEKGAEVALLPEAMVAGGKAIHVFTDREGSQHSVLCEFVPVGGLPDFNRKYHLEKEEEDTDARVLPILVKGKLRFREFGDAVDKLEEVKFEDWDKQVPGPRTVMWCARFLKKRGGPLAHHEWWKSVTKLGESDFGVGEHEGLLRAFQCALEYDQLDVGNLACMEHMMRRAQLVEYYHRERTRLEMQDSHAKSGVDTEEQLVFLGTHHNLGNLMICPDLVQFASKELERMSAIDKQSRKAREERALRRK